MQDLLSKYSVYTLLANCTAKAIANAFISYFICRFRCPKNILTDQGRNFVSKLRSLYKLEAQQTDRFSIFFSDQSIRMTRSGFYTINT